MKKFMAIILTLIMVLSLALTIGCQKKTEETKPAETPAPAAPSPAAPAPSPEAPAASPAAPAPSPAGK